MAQEQAIDLILASASPRRRELLVAAGWNVEVRVPQVNESLRQGEAPEQYVTRLAREKAEAIAQQLARHPSLAAVPIVGADTAVVVEDEILGKPSSPADAARMLRRLAGRSHQVWTGVCVLHPPGDVRPAKRGRRTARQPTPHATRRARQTAVCTTVWFSPMSADEIDEYVRSGEPMDKAGAYAIQGRAAKFIPRIEGCYSNVVGLPLSAVRELLRQSSG